MSGFYERLRRLLSAQAADASLPRDLRSTFGGSTSKGGGEEEANDAEQEQVSTQVQQVEEQPSQKEATTAQQDFTQLSRGKEEPLPQFANKNNVPIANGSDGVAHHVHFVQSERGNEGANEQHEGEAKNNAAPLQTKNGRDDTAAPAPSALGRSDAARAGGEVDMHGHPIRMGTDPFLNDMVTVLQRRSRRSRNSSLRRRGSGKGSPRAATKSTSRGSSSQARHAAHSSQSSPPASPATRRAFSPTHAYSSFAQGGNPPVDVDIDGDADDDDAHREPFLREYVQQPLFHFIAFTLLLLHQLLSATTRLLAHQRKTMASGIEALVDAAIAILPLSMQAAVRAVLMPQASEQQHQAPPSHTAATNRQLRRSSSTKSNWKINNNDSTKSRSGLARDSAATGHRRTQSWHVSPLYSPVVVATSSLHGNRGETAAADDDDAEGPFSSSSLARTSSERAPVHSSYLLRPDASSLSSDGEDPPTGGDSSDTGDMIPGDRKGRVHRAQAPCCTLDHSCVASRGSSHAATRSLHSSHRELIDRGGDDDLQTLHHQQQRKLMKQDQDGKGSEEAEGDGEEGVGVQEDPPGSQPTRGSFMTRLLRAVAASSAAKHLHQLLSSVLIGRIILDGVEMLHSVAGFWAQQGWRRYSPALLQKQHILKEMTQAETYEEWVELALEADRLSGNDKWKMAFESRDYNYMLLRDHLDALCQARKRGDTREMMWLLRQTLHRQIAGMGNEKLFARSYTGTKVLIEQYVDEVLFQLHHVATTPIPNVTQREKVQMFQRLQVSFGRSALMLSGGGGMGVHHLGVIRTLHEQGVLPRIICGSSVGSLIATGVCTTPDEDLRERLSGIKPLLDNPYMLAREGEEENFFTRLARLFSQGTLADVTVLRDCCIANIGDITFREAYEKTGRILNITINARDSGEPPRLLNYITAPDVVIWSAACASCALMLLFDPVEIYVKTPEGILAPWNPGQMKWSDGSVQTDLPMDRLRELFNVNHFIVSQVNPHAVVFLRYKTLLTNQFFTWLRAELTYRLVQLQSLAFKPHVVVNMRTLIDQPYAGDITITPKFTLTDYLNIVSNPTDDRLRYAIRSGQLATWPKMNMVFSHCRIEVAIDQALMALNSIDEWV